MIRIITDTSADITASQAKELQVDIVPLEIHFEGAPYDPLADETFDVFYRMLESAKQLPTTSQPAPGKYLSLYSQALAAGDDAVVITISSKISGTYQSAMIAREMAADASRIHVVDSLSAITGQRLLVELAVNLRAKGLGAAEIAEAIRDAADRVVLIAGLDTLKYLRKGGRIPKSAEVLGTVLGVKPLLQLENGSIVMAGKARGRTAVIGALLDMVAEKADFDPSMPVYFGYTHEDAQCNAFHKAAMEKFDLKNTVQYPIGSVVATHVGPGAFAIVYLRRG